MSVRSKQNHLVRCIIGDEFPEYAPNNLFYVL